MTSSDLSAEEEMRRRIFGGGRLLLENLSRDELSALYPMLINGDAEIINEACKPYVIRKLPRW
ncbi:hypothetical protein [Ruegeria arenilitoris]|uniref:hypothetical protein n=1 Tax=Ruegeria arenilitoris TaxID=1173585 RepID=UPI00147D0FC8|nr:hypothetical protein [Ruegeria arenilitoris]